MLYQVKVGYVSIGQINKS